MFQCLIVSPLTAHFHVCWHYSLKQSEAGKINQIWKFRSGNNWVWQGEHMWNLSKYNVSLLYEMLSAHPWQISLSYNPQLVVSDLWCTLLIGFWQNNLQQLHTISLSPLGCFSKIYELQAEFFFFSFFLFLLFCVQAIHQNLKAVLRGKIMLHNNRFFTEGLHLLNHDNISELFQTGLLFLPHI